MSRKIINLFGQPGAGKSTGASLVYGLLKLHDVNAELVQEYAKERAWEGTLDHNYNQVHSFAEQENRQFKLKNAVDVVVTDSPILLSLAYYNNELFGEFVKWSFNQYDNMNFFVKRVKPYKKEGRIQTEHESDRLADKIENILKTNSVEYVTVEGNVQGYNTIVENVLIAIGKTVTPRFTISDNGGILQ